MEELVPWSRLQTMIEPFYDDAFPAPWLLPVMLRVFVMQRWFGYSAGEMADALCTQVLLRRFAGIGRGDRIPDEQVILAFHRLLEEHHLVQATFAMTLGSVSEVATTRCAGRQ